MFMLVDIIEALRYKSPLRKQGIKCEKLKVKFNSAPKGKQKGKALDEYTKAVKHMKSLKAKYVCYGLPRNRDYYQHRGVVVFDYDHKEVSPVTFRRLP